MILPRIQACLHNHQPEEQHGFRAGRRLKEHLLTANLFLDRTLAANMPVWIVNLDLSTIREVFPWNPDFVGQTGTILRWCRREIKWGQNRVDHNASSATTIFDYFDWSRYQGKGAGNGSQMVGLYVVSSRFQKCNSGNWLPFTVCGSNFFCIHQKQIENLQCHRDTNRLFWSWAPMHPPCRYGQTWRKKNLISTFDVWSEHAWSSRRDLLGGIRGTKFCMSGINACEKWWEHVSMSHENMGRNLRFWTLEILRAISWISLTNVGHAGCYIGNLLEEDLWDVQLWIGGPNLHNFLKWNIGVIEGCGCRCWPVDAGGGRVHQILYTVFEFVSQVVWTFRLFVLVRALKWAAFSACEPPTPTLLCACMSEGSPLWVAGNVRPKHHGVEQSFTKSSLTCTHTSESSEKLCHWPNCWNRVCATSFARPIMSWEPPCSCTSPIPKQHSLDPPVRTGLRERGAALFWPNFLPM